MLGLALLPEPAAAWGDQGHKVICEIASRLVQPSTRAEIQKLISTDDRFTSFCDLALFVNCRRNGSRSHDRPSGFRQSG